MLFVHADHFALPLEPAARARVAPTDADLVARAKERDRAAEEAIYRRHVRYVAGVIGRLLDNPAEAEDCVQETFAIALERIRDVRDGGAVRAWLAQIAVSRVRRRHRTRKLMRLLGLDRAPEALELEGSAWAGASPEVSADVARLHALLVTLPSAQRIAWSLRRVEGHALEEVAAVCRCSLATAKRRIAAADARVREVFAEGPP